MEHPDLPSHPTTGQDVGLLVVEGEGGPCQGEEVLLDILVFVLHQDFPRVDVDDADGVAATGRHPRSRLALLLGVGLKDNLNKSWSKLGKTKMQKRWCYTVGLGWMELDHHVGSGIDRTPFGDNNLGLKGNSRPPRSGPGCLQAHWLIGT